MNCDKTYTYFETGKLRYFKISGWNMAEDRLHTEGSSFIWAYIKI